MEGTLSLTHTFKYKSIEDTYTITFKHESINIRSSNIDENIKLTNVSKIRYSSKKIKIKLISGEIIKIPVTKKEMVLVNEMFMIENNTDYSEPICSVKIIFGKCLFFINLSSYSITDMKLSVFSRISKHFFPALEGKNIDINEFSNFKIFIEDGGKGFIESDKDLKAACMFYNNHIVLHVTDQ